jgi:exodeoxyribonuclease VII small subunit
MPRVRDVTGASEPTSLSYEQARDELAGVVRALEAGGLTLEQSLVLWERGEVLADRCQALLDEAEQRLQSAQRSRETNDSTAE